MKNTSQLLPETGRSQVTNIETPKQTNWIEMHQSQVKMCFLRGLLWWLTEQKNPKFLRSLQNVQGNTTNLAISINSVNVIALMEMRVVKLHEFKTAAVNFKISPYDNIIITFAC